MKTLMRQTLPLQWKEIEMGRREKSGNMWWIFYSAKETSLDYKNRLVG